MNARISLNDYEVAERDLYRAHARTIWRRHAFLFAAVLLVLILAAIGPGVSWLAFLAVSTWAVVLAVHYNGWVRHSDERIREQQGRIEWRAGGTNQRLLPRG
jgi:fatty acid desaturase